MEITRVQSVYDHHAAAKETAAAAHSAVFQRGIETNRKEDAIEKAAPPCATPQGLATLYRARQGL